MRRPSLRPGLRAMRSPKLTIAAVLSSGHEPTSAAESSTVMPRRIAVPYSRARGPGSPSAGVEIRSSLRRLRVGAPRSDLLVASFQYQARSVRLSTFPLGLRGSASMMSAVRGHLQ